MITDADVTKLKKVFVTKSYFTKELKRLDRRFDGLKMYIDLRLEPLNGLGEFKESVLKTLDWLVGAFKKFDEEHTILAGRYGEINMKIENHESRIGLLEKKTYSD